METKELNNIPGLDPDEVVTIRKLGFGSIGNLRSKIIKTNVDPLTKEANTQVDIGAMMKWLVVLGVHKAKFWEGKPTLIERAKYIEDDGLSIETGQHLFNELREFNNLEKVEELKKN